jgi:hypothetical protein
MDYVLFVTWIIILTGSAIAATTYWLIIYKIKKEYVEIWNSWGKPKINQFAGIEINNKIMKTIKNWKINNQKDYKIQNLIKILNRAVYVKFAWLALLIEIVIKIIVENVKA